MRFAAATLLFAALALLAWSAQSQTKPKRQTEFQTKTQNDHQTETQTKTQNELQTKTPARPLPPTVSTVPAAAARSGFGGLILGTNGQPCAGVTVFIGSGGETVATTTADAHGVFAIDLPPGDYTLSADGDLGASAPVDLTLAAGERLDGLTLELRETAAPAYTIELDEDGRKIIRITDEIIID